MTRDAGFSLLEMTIAMSLMLLMMAGVFSTLDPAHGAFSTQPEKSDMQQRLRVASDSLFKDLVMAGAGAYQGLMSGPLVDFFAPVMPYRNGSTSDDPPGVFRTDTVTVMYVPSAAAQGRLVDKGPTSNSAAVGIDVSAGCPAGDPACGFKRGMSVLLYDDAGHFDTFTVAGVGAGGQLQLDHNSDELTYTGYDKEHTRIVQVALVVYYLKADAAAGTYQLMQYDGGLSGDVPVADNVVRLEFEYYGDPQPPLMRKPLSEVNGPWTSYGPPPKAVEAPPFGAGENCLFVSDGSPLPSPRLEIRGVPGSALVRLAPGELTDGPWCPSDDANNRFDADLFRVRRIGVSIRVQSALAALRGPAGVLFTHGGTSRGGSRWLPDQEVHFEVTPRNLSLGR
jgi:prepilin-type N-terminal cleavage/methylation domain-containing protein